MAPLDVSSDYAVMDGLATVTYFVRTSESVYDAGRAVQFTLGRAANRDEILAAGALLSEVTTTWHMWVSTLGAVSPKVGDRIVDTLGFKWQVRKAEFNTLNTRWKLTAVKER